MHYIIAKTVPYKYIDSSFELYTLFLIHLDSKSIKCTTFNVHTTLHFQDLEPNTLFGNNLYKEFELTTKTQKITYQNLTSAMLPFFLMRQILYRINPKRNSSRIQTAAKDASNATISLPARGLSYMISNQKFRFLQLVHLFKNPLNDKFKHVLNDQLSSLASIDWGFNNWKY